MKNKDHKLDQILSGQHVPKIEGKKKPFKYFQSHDSDFGSKGYMNSQTVKMFQKEFGKKSK